jgi:hypothetical protein
MPTNQIPRKRFGYHPEEEEKGVGHQRDERTSSSEPHIGTGQNVRTLQLMMVQCESQKIK